METLQEYVSVGGGVRVDRANGVIRNCRIIGRESKNGRSYPAETLKRAIGLYENASVNVNHPKGNPGASRDYQDRIGRIAASRPMTAGCGDFQFNPKHALAEQLIWDAEHAPENVGFSHNVEAKLGHKGGRVIVEEITRVQSVDLVADPASSRGLFESLEEDAVRRSGGWSRRWPQRLDCLSGRFHLWKAGCLIVSRAVKSKSIFAHLKEVYEQHGAIDPNYKSGCTLLCDVLGTRDPVGAADFVDAVTDDSDAGPSSDEERDDFLDQISD